MVTAVILIWVSANLSWGDGRWSRIVTSDGNGYYAYLPAIFIYHDLQYNFIPVIMLTSSKNEEDIARSYKYGAASFIQKPVNYESFVKVVESFNYYWHIVNKLPRSDVE